MKLNTWFTNQNVNDQYNNRRVRYYNGSVYKFFDFPPGNYSADDIVDYIAYIIDQNGDDPNNLILMPNLNTGKFVLTLLSGYKLDLSVGAMYITLGADNIEYSASTSFPNQAEITFDVSMWNISMSCLRGGYSGRGVVKTLVDFVPSLITPPGGNIEVAPSFAQYVLLEPSDNIQQIRIRLLDQLGRPIDILNQPLSLICHVRPLFRS